MKAFSVQPIKWSISNIIIAIIVIAGLVAILWIALTNLGIAIPAWVISVFWVVAIVVVCCLAVKFIVSLFNGPPPNPPSI